MVGGRWRKSTFVTVLAILACLQGGCGTLSDIMCGPVDNNFVYRGVRLDIMGIQEGGWMTAMLFDIPFSAVADTVLLPYCVLCWIVRGPMDERLRLEEISESEAAQEVNQKSLPPE